MDLDRNALWGNTSVLCTGGVLSEVPDDLQVNPYQGCPGSSGD